MELVVGRVVVHVLVPRHRVRDVLCRVRVRVRVRFRVRVGVRVPPPPSHLVEEARRLEGPAARDVTYRVAASAQHEQGHVEALHVLEALGVPTDAQVPAADAVARERVGAAAEDDGARLEVRHHL